MNKANKQNKNSVSIWYTLVLAMTLTSCFQTKDGSPTKAATADKPIVVPQLDPKSPAPAEELAIPVKEKPVETKTTKDQSKLACIQSVCGNDYALTPDYVRRPEIFENNAKVINEKLGRSLEIKMDQTVKNHLSAGAAIKAITPSQISHIQFSSEQIGFLNAFKYLNEIKKYYSSIERDTKGSIVFNKEKLKKNNPTLTADEIEAIASLSAIFLVNDYQQVDALTYKYILNQLKKSYAKAAKVDFLKVQEIDVLKYTADMINDMRVNLFSRVYIKELLVNEIQMVVDKAVAKKDLSMREKLDLIQKFGSYYFIKVLITDEKIQSTFGKLPFSGEELLSRITRNFKSTFEETYSDKMKFKTTFASELAACKKDLTRSLSDTPTAKEVKRAEMLTALLVDKANVVINRKASQSSKLEVEFIMPKSQDEVLKDWLARFEADFKEAEMVGQTIKNIKPIDVDGNFLATLAVLYGKQSSMFSAIRETCESEEPSFLSDAALPNEKTLRTSSVVVKNIDVALGVIAHEIGHIVKESKEDLFKGELSCLESNYGSKQYQDEDFADLFSTKLMEELYGEKKLTVNKNMICTFPDFKMLKLAELNLTNASKSDVHSSALHRLLGVSAAAGSMTEQCSSYLNQHEPQTKVFNNYCKWQD